MLAVMGKGRVETFSDGVLAIVITLLVLDLHVEAGGDLMHQLGEHWANFAAFAVTFFVTGVIWINHHGLFTLIDRLDRVLLFENLVLLMFVTTLPFTTSTLAAYIQGDGRDARWAVGLYGVSTIGIGISFILMLHRIVKHELLIEPVAEAVGRRAVRRFAIGNVAYPIATLLGLVWPPLMLFAVGGITLYYAVDQFQVLPSSPASATKEAQRGRSGAIAE